MSETKTSESKFSLAECEDDAAWDAFVDASPEGTVFSYSAYLAAVGVPYRRWWIRKGERVRAALVVLLSEDEQRCVLNDLVIYNGLMFARDDQNQKRVTLISEQFQIGEFAVDFLSGTYASVELSLAPDYGDIRPFLWHNYHENDADRKYAVDVRYTSFLELPETDDAEAASARLLAEMDYRQRNVVKKAVKNGVRVVEKLEPDLFVKMYRRMMAEQSDGVSAEKSAALERVVLAMHAAGRAKMYLAENAEGEPANISLFCFDAKRAYYWFGVGAPEIRDNYFGTYGLYESMVRLSAEGIRQIDLEGVNSPFRGRFKLSFGGSLESYYELNLKAGGPA